MAVAVLNYIAGAVPIVGTIILASVTGIAIPAGAGHTIGVLEIANVADVVVFTARNLVGVVETLNRRCA